MYWRPLATVKPFQIFTRPAVRSTSDHWSATSSLLRVPVNAARAIAVAMSGSSTSAMPIRSASCSGVGVFGSRRMIRGGEALSVGARSR